MQIDHCTFWKSDYNAGRNQKGSVRQMSTTKKRSILQILKDAGATQDLYGSFYWAAQEPHRRVIAILNLVCCLALIAAAVLYTFNVKFMDDRRLRIYDTEDDADEL